MGGGGNSAEDFPPALEVIFAAGAARVQDAPGSVGLAGGGLIRDFACRARRSRMPSGSQRDAGAAGTQLRHFKMTGPVNGCFISPPVLRASKYAAFNPKYHFAGRSASSISIRCGLRFNPSDCLSMV